MKMTVTVTRTTEREVLPCPFCNSEKLILFETVGETYRIRCDECDSYGGIGESQESAIDKWNTRKYIPKK